MIDTQVLVVGAGLAGLSAADALAGQGWDVTVWEARDRAGGRTLTTEVGGMCVDMGAQWLGPAQPRMHELARRFGLATFPTHSAGRAVLVDGGRRRTYRGTVPLLGPVQLARMARGLLRFRSMAADPEGVGEATLAAVLDSAVGRSSARRIIDAATRVIFGAEPGELDAAWVAAYSRAAGGDLLDLAAIEGGAQQTRLVGGTQAFSVALAEGLRVELGRPVAAIAQDASGVTVTATTGEQARAEQAVVAVPTPLVGRITFTPPLPASRVALEQRMVMGATTKVVAVYDEPFWRAEGLNGEAVLTDGPVQVAFDNTAHDGSVPALLAFVTGRAAVEAADRPVAELREAVLAALGRAFGPRAWAAEQVVTHQWPLERWTGGCPTANLTPGAAWTAASLRRSCGLVHFAGTETSTDWAGYMEGAVASGRRAAADVAGGSPSTVTMSPPP